MKLYYLTLLTYLSTFLSYTEPLYTNNLLHLSVDIIAQFIPIPPKKAIHPHIALSGKAALQNRVSKRPLSYLEYQHYGIGFKTRFKRKEYSFNTSSIKELQLDNDSVTVKTNQNNTYSLSQQYNYEKHVGNQTDNLNRNMQDDTSFQYHKYLFDMGLKHYDRAEYYESETYFQKARIYFERGKEDNHREAFLEVVKYEALAAYHLKRYNHSQGLLQQGISEIRHLKEHRQSTEKEALNYILALNLFELHYHECSVNLLKELQNAKLKSNDYVRECNWYYYLGLNHWNLNHRDIAVAYFEKVDAIYNSKSHSNLQLKNSYTYLIDYYEELGDSKKVLYFTKQLLAVSVHLQREYRHTNKLISQPMGQAEATKNKLNVTNELDKSNSVMKLIAVLVVLLIAHLFSYFIFVNQQRQRFKNQTKELSTTVLNTTTHTEKSNTLNIKDSILKEILQHLEDFENNKEFLSENIHLNNLALQWHTNRNYLSNCINTYKEKSFIDYVNDLRIKYFIEHLKENHKRFRCLTIAAIGQELGFSSARSFSKAFVKVRNISLSHYLAQYAQDME